MITDNCKESIYIGGPQRQVHHQAIYVLHSNQMASSITTSVTDNTQPQNKDALQEAFGELLENYFVPEEEPDDNWGYTPLPKLTAEELDQIARDWSEYNLRLCALSWAGELVAEQLRLLDESRKTHN